MVLVLVLILIRGGLDRGGLIRKKMPENRSTISACVQSGIEIVSVSKY